MTEPDWIKEIEDYLYQEPSAHSPDYLDLNGDDAKKLLCALKMAMKALEFYSTAFEKGWNENKSLAWYDEGAEAREALDKIRRGDLE